MTTEYYTCMAVPQKLWPLKPEVAERIDKMQRLALERAGCTDIDMGEWRWTFHEAYFDEEGEFHEAWSSWARTATGVANA